MSVVYYFVRRTARIIRTQAPFTTQTCPLGRLKSVITKEKSYSMQSFIFAETFKYFYLLFALPETLDFDKVIFNTEPHPTRKTW